MITSLSTRSIVAALRADAERVVAVAGFDDRVALRFAARA